MDNAIYSQRTIGILHLAKALVESRRKFVYNIAHGKRDFIFLPVLRPQQQVCIFMCSTPCGIQRLRSRYFTSGGLAQLGEHYVRNVGVGGSTPLPSTKPSLLAPRAGYCFIVIAARG